MSGTSLALKIGTLVFGLGVYFVLLKKVKGLKKYGLSSLIYVIVVALILALSTLLLLLNQTSSEVYKLIYAQLFIVVLGTTHVLLSGKLLPWYSEQTFNMQLVYIICILLFTYLFCNLSFTFLVKTFAELAWYLSLLWFLVPVLLNQTIIRLLDVPPKEYKKWQYPVNITIEDPSDEEMENPVVISFVFQKNRMTSEYTTFRAKAPVGMALGRLFFFFINDYNNRHPESTISFLDENKEPDKWMFFKLKNKLLRLKEPVEPDDSIYNSNIKENDILICKRYKIF